MKIKALITLNANGKTHTPQAVLDIADEEAQRLITRGFALSVTQSKAEPAKTTNQPPPSLEDIVEAIAGLDPAKDYGKSGKPNVEPIEALLGADITAAQRDQAWELFKQEAGDAA